MNDQTELQKEIFNYLLDNGFTQGEDGGFALDSFYWANRQDTPVDKAGLFEYSPGRKIPFLCTEPCVSVHHVPVYAALCESYSLRFQDEEGDEIITITVSCEMEAAARKLLLERFTLVVVEYAKLSSAFMAICNE